MPIAESLLVLGCRDPEDDLHYADELAGTGEADAEAWFPGLRAGGRYLEDIWGGSAVV